MEKLVYLSYDDEARALRELVGSATLTREIESAALCVLRPSSRRGPSAAITAWLPCIDRRASLENLLGRVGARFYAYVATESRIASPALPDVTPATLELMEKPQNTKLTTWLDSLERSPEGMRDGLVFARNVLVRALSPTAPRIHVLREGVGARARDSEPPPPPMGERISQLSMYATAQSFGGERIVLKRGRI